MKSSLDVILALEATNSRLDKERIIKQAWDLGLVEFFKGARLAYDALITFGVRKTPLIDGVDDPNFKSSMTWDKFVDLAGKLQRRELTGNTARDVLRAAAESSSTAEWNGWYRRILQKDLKIGCSDSTINKVLEAEGKSAEAYITPVFSCQLAKNGEDHPKKLKGLKFIDPKLDGARLLTILNIENQTVIQYSRDGRVNDRFEVITNDLLKLLPKLQQSIVFDGEVISRNFQELMKQFNRKEDVNMGDAKLALFDIIPLKDFLAGECKLTQTQRHQILTGFAGALQECCGERVYVIPKLIVNLDTPEGQDKFKEFNRETIEAGYEGIMVKDPQATYRTKRTDAWLKIKPKLSFDLEIIGFEAGTPENKFANTLGGLICKGEDQGKIIEVTVGGGFSEKLRDQIWNNKDEVLGQIVEIEGDMLTKAQESDIWSIRFPVFARFRGFEPGQKI
jgi:DNA ligase-1